MEINDSKIMADNLKFIHPSFFQYLPVFVLPFAFFLLVVLGMDVFYVLLGFFVLEMFLLLTIWLLLATITYIIKTDRLEIRSGILIKLSTAIPFDKIINITCKQNLFQKIFNIGNVFIEIPGVEPFEVALFGIEKHEEVAEFLFALKKRGEI